MAPRDDYRRHAAACLALAQRTANPDDKARLLQMAQAWVALADKSKPKKDKPDFDAD